MLADGWADSPHKKKTKKLMISNENDVQIENLR